MNRGKGERVERLYRAVAAIAQRPNCRCREREPLKGKGETMSVRDIKEFVRESNAIEGIRRPPTRAEVAAHRAFLGLPDVRVDDVRELVGVCQLRARLRDQEGMDVRVGGYTPPPGGPQIVASLASILRDVGDRDSDPWDIHVMYERLHPFTDGNGRSGRALWYWMMLRTDPAGASLGFLHAWYYQTLRHADALLATAR